MIKVGKDTLEIMREAGWYYHRLFSLVEAYLRGEILEVGAGIGSFTEFLVKKGNLTVIEINKSYVKKLKGRFKNSLKVGWGDIEKGSYFFDKKKFDTLVCLNVLEHIKNDKKALKNMASLLKTDGNLILLVPAHPIAFGSLDKNLGHYRRYSKHRLKKDLEEAGFNVEKIYYFNWFGFLGWFLNSRILKRKILPGKQLTLFNFLGKPFIIIERLVKPLFGLSILAMAVKK